MTSLRHRIPVRVRHYWKLLATCVIAVAGLVLLAGNIRVTPIVTSQAAERDKSYLDIAGKTDLYDASVAHSMSITYDEADYQRMFDEYMATGDKQYVRADVTIDGTLLEDVGIRLKGNSTLSGVTHKGRTRSLRGGPGGGVAVPNPGGVMPPDGVMPPGGMMGPGGGQGGFGRVSLDSARPEELPWLMSFDEFVEDRRYQGRGEISLRVGGMGGGTTAINEAVSLSVLGAVGQTTQRYAYAGFKVNDRPVKARLLVEHPDKGYADTLGDGVLYKSLATGQFTYQGEDPTGYEDDFKQINKKGNYDLKPVIDLIKWVNEASDADFAAHLADHVDVESFAAYAAMQNLLLNFDDMAGPGKNYYLWYDLGTERFKVISWDHNLTFRGSATAGPHDVISMGGGRFIGPGGQQPQATQVPQGRVPAGGGRGGFGGNKLKERFLAAEAFKPVYEEAYRTFYRKVFADKTAENALAQISATLGKVAGTDAATIAADTEQLRTLIQQRTAALAAHEVVTRP